MLRYMSSFFFSDANQIFRDVICWGCSGVQEGAAWIKAEESEYDRPRAQHNKSTRVAEIFHHVWLVNK
jgi:hypothetical protein